MLNEIQSHFSSLTLAFNKIQHSFYDKAHSPVTDSVLHFWHQQIKYARNISFSAKIDQFKI